MKSLCQLSYHIAIKFCNSYILGVNDLRIFLREEIFIDFRSLCVFLLLLFIVQEVEN